MKKFFPQAVFAAVLFIATMIHGVAAFHAVSPSEPSEIFQVCSGYDCPPGTVSAWSAVYPDAKGSAAHPGWQPAVYLAPGPDSAFRDVYVAEFRLTADGRIFDMRRARNLSMTNEADEDVLRIVGKGRVVYAGRSASGYGGVDLVDFSGEPASLTADWPAPWRLANRINSFQSTGRWKGLHLRSFRFEASAERVDVRAADGGFFVRADAQTLAVGVDGGIDAGTAQVNEMVRGRPAFLAWAVDTVRALPWVGRTKIEWLEKLWFDFDDWLSRTRWALSGGEEEDTDPVATAEMASRVAKIKKTPGLLVGWPPPAIPPMLSSKKTDDVSEGVWLPMDRAPLMGMFSGPPLFFETYVRPDAERPYSRLQIVAWDPARVSLHMMAGVREPQSSTGVRGKGEIPRDARGVDHVSRLVGAFNGAFQALHGEWGMIQNREVLLPLRPWGASVAVFEDGRVGMGSWPYPEPELPADIVDVRQNIHALLENGRFNPYRREWWGGVPQGMTERVVTTRSGLCLSKTGKLMYFWGRHLSPESLAAGMKAAECDFGMHLDMNSGHCGFEYYRVDAVAEIESFAGSLQKKMEVTEPVPGRKDLAFIARKLVDGMGSMRFPRYINRDPRDFFYLTVEDSVFDHPPEKAAWRPLSSEVGLPVAGVMVSAGDQVVYKFDPAQIALSLEESEPTEETLLAMPFADAVLAEDRDGFVFVAQKSDAEFLRTLASQRVEKLPSPVDLSAGEGRWLVIRSAPKAAYERLYPEVKPVPPSVWREAYRKRGRLLKPPEDSDDVSTEPPTAAP